jgi:hypothetical protein
MKDANNSGSKACALDKGFHSHRLAADCAAKGSVDSIEGREMESAAAVALNSARRAADIDRERNGSGQA